MIAVLADKRAKHRQGAHFRTMTTSECTKSTHGLLQTRDLVVVVVVVVVVVIVVVFPFDSPYCCVEAVTDVACACSKC